MFFHLENVRFLLLFLSLLLGFSVLFELSETDKSIIMFTYSSFVVLWPAICTSKFTIFTAWRPRIPFSLPKPSPISLAFLRFFHLGYQYHYFFAIIFMIFIPIFLSLWDEIFLSKHSLLHKHTGIIYSLSQLGLCVSVLG